MKSNLFTNFAVCQLFLDVCVQIVRHDNLSVHVQGSNAPCESSRIQIMRKSGQNIRFLSAGDCQARKQKPNK